MTPGLRPVMAHRRQRPTLLLAIFSAALLPLVLPACLVAGLAGLAGDTPPLDVVGGVPTTVAQAYQAAARQCAQASTGPSSPPSAASNPTTAPPAAPPSSTNTGDAPPGIYGPQLDGPAEPTQAHRNPWVGWWGRPDHGNEPSGPCNSGPPPSPRTPPRRDDGNANPHDLDDAAATTAAYLCAAAGGRSMARRDRPHLQPSQASDDAVTHCRTTHQATGRATCSDRRRAMPRHRARQLHRHLALPPIRGRIHQGVDMFAPEGTPVVALAPGRVEHYEPHPAATATGSRATTATAATARTCPPTPTKAQATSPAAPSSATSDGPATQPAPPPTSTSNPPRRPRRPPVNPTPTAAALCVEQHVNGATALRMAPPIP